MGQQNHKNEEVEGELVCDPTKGKAPVEESVGESYPHHLKQLKCKEQGLKQQVKGVINP